MRTFKETFSFISETIRIVILALVIILPIRAYVFQPFFVRGASMEPNFHNGDYLIIDELTYRLREPGRGEVIVFRYPADPSQFYIKRIIGLPGETIILEGGKIFVSIGNGPRKELSEIYLSPEQRGGSDSEVTLGPDEYFVLGDNRQASSDSRSWGGLGEEYVVGKVLVTVWPPADFAVFAAPNY